MKTPFYALRLPRVNLVFLSVALLGLCGCGKWIVPPEYTGQWETSKARITVRTKAKSEPFRFTSDSASVRITINADKTVSGRVGTAEFTNAPLEKNYVLPGMKANPVYIIKCGPIGKIFENDPLNHKEVEIWFAPINSDGNSESGLRYTQWGAQFPMADLLFMKVRDQKK